MRYGKRPESVYIRRSRLGEPYHPTLVQVDNGHARALPFITEEMIKGQWTFSKRCDVSNSSE